MPFFRELWMLVKGIAYSLKTLLWGLFMGALLIFIFAIFITTIVKGSSEEQMPVIDGYPDPHVSHVDNAAVRGGVYIQCAFHGGTPQLMLQQDAGKNMERIRNTLARIHL